MSIDQQFSAQASLAGKGGLGSGLESVTGEFRTIDGELWYRIANTERLAPFFMSLISSEDHWMYIASSGALTCGRRDANQALFPYYSADKLLDLVESTGPRTIVRVQHDGRTVCWEPFSNRGQSFEIRRSLYKNRFGSRLLFEETNLTLGLMFRYQWASSRQFGFVRSVDLVNLESEARKLTILDGLENLLPPGIDQNFQLRFSNLADAYKKSELLPKSGLGVFYLSSIPTDRAEPSEGLLATVAWQTGLDDALILLSSRQLNQFRRVGVVEPEVDVRGQRHSYFAVQTVEIAGRDLCSWRMVADVAREQSSVVALKNMLEQSEDLDSAIDSELTANDEALLAFAAGLDGLQLGADQRRTTRHLANSLFNAMRGGLPASGYQLSKVDFIANLTIRNREVASLWAKQIEALPDTLSYAELQAFAKSTGDQDLIRLAGEFLPLTFGRRHGDPTRPWNQFRIADRDERGERRLGFEGNWRDIFQNWEALGLAYPQFLPGMVLRFVNATTADGYNPYRVNQSGFDWERPDPEDPWANIGYWGDHQIVYLLKLLEQTRAFWPEQLSGMLDSQSCVHAEVPYRIAGYAETRANPRETISYDRSVEERLEQEVHRIGTDGQLSRNAAGEIQHASLLEKLLLTGVVKLANLVPGAGIWLNTQRPEWNDAQNALAGFGASIVTVCYLRRYLEFIRSLLSEKQTGSLSLSQEFAGFLKTLAELLSDRKLVASSCLDASARECLVEKLQSAAEAYRAAVYKGLSGKYEAVTHATISGLLDSGIDLLTKTLELSRRADGLYHSFNLLNLVDGAIEIEHLDEMLEGQVAIMESGLLSSSEAAELLTRLRQSQLWRADQQSYLLYPNRGLARFLEKNRLPSDLGEAASLVQRVSGNHAKALIRRDADNSYRFAGQFRNLKDLQQAMESWQDAPEVVSRENQTNVDSGLAHCLSNGEKRQLENLWEETFHHRRFTGRSSSFFAYEGLGSIYWHMVSKLATAVARTCQVAQRHSDPAYPKLLEQFREVYEGMWLNKSPESYGAFPTDPYSHTPAHAGAQQPGMTGQVKEDLVTRLCELGVIVENGTVTFDPALLRADEALRTPSKLAFVGLSGERTDSVVESGSLAFSLCQTPIVYQTSELASEIAIEYQDGKRVVRSGSQLSADESRELFNRTGAIRKIEVSFPRSI
ncbi:MAG: hypothetical protein ACKO0N_04600 [Planctomycetota bacterium]